MKPCTRPKADKQRVIELEYRVNLLAIILKDNNLITKEQYKKLIEVKN